jgi:DNA invertase Pin-like site-specific DNA recombinase
MSDKIKPHHLGRKAVLYVRQSSAHQVMHNQESRILSPTLPRQTSATIRSKPARVTAPAAERPRSSSMTSISRQPRSRSRSCTVAAREVSRFARNSRDWQQLIEMCRVVDTLLVDQEAVYAPRQGNDRLLLGLKGSLNEYELDLLRQRSLAARYEKARRGELIVAAPIGSMLRHDVRPAAGGSRCSGSVESPAAGSLKNQSGIDLAELFLYLNTRYRSKIWSRATTCMQTGATIELFLSGPVPPFIMLAL